MAVKPGSFFKKPYGNTSATSPRDAFVQKTATQLSNFGSAYSPRPASFTQPGLPGSTSVTSFKQPGISAAPLQPNVRTPAPRSIPTANAATYAPPAYSPTVSSPQPGYNQPPSKERFIQSNTQPRQRAQSQSPTAAGSSPYDMAVKAYLDSLKESDSVKSARQRYLNFIQSRDTGLQNIEDQPIAMQFITGQQRSVANRAEIQANRLQGDVNMAEQSQQARQQFAKGLLDIESDRQKPIGVGDSLLQINPATGKYEPTYTAPASPADGFTLGKDQARYDATGKLIAGSTASADDSKGPSAYQSERSFRNIQSIDELLTRIGPNTVGVGNLLSILPATQARDFTADLNTLKANIAFGELTAMREASKTGGALGAVSEKELTLLESALGGLDPKQSPANFAKNLNQIKTSIYRWQQAAQSLGGGSTGGGSIYDF